MKASFMKSYSPFLKLHNSLGEIDTKIKMIWAFFKFWQLAIFKVL